MPAYELMSLSPNPGQTDLMSGDGTGAYLRYGSDDRVEGMPCSVTSTSGLRCDAGLTCRELCPGDRTSGRCVELCNTRSALSCTTSPARPRCLAGPEGDTIGYCGGPGLACRSLNSVVRLETVHDVTRARISGDDIDDALIVGSGSAVPGVGMGGSVRIAYGGPHNLTRLDDLDPETRRTTFVDLFASRLPGSDAALGPRTVEVGDFNGDGVSDLAVIYVLTEELRVWLGGNNLVAGEIGPRPGTSSGGRVRLNDCEGSCPSSSRCFPFSQFAVADLDADGRSDIIAMCDPDVVGLAPSLLWFSPSAE